MKGLLPGSKEVTEKGYPFDTQKSREEDVGSPEGVKAHKAEWESLLPCLREETWRTQACRQVVRDSPVAES